MLGFIEQFFCKKDTDTILNKRNDQTRRLVFDDLPNLILCVCTRFQLYLQASTHQVTEDFEVAYARAVRHYKRNLRLRWIQIVLRICLLLVLLVFLGIAVCLFLCFFVTCTSPDPPTPRPTTQKTSTSPIMTETSHQPTTTTAIIEPTLTSKRTTTIQTTAMTTSTSSGSPSTTSTSTSAYRPIPNYSGENKALKTLQSGRISLD